MSSRFWPKLLPPRLHPWLPVTQPSTRLNLRDHLTGKSLQPAILWMGIELLPGRRLLGPSDGAPASLYAESCSGFGGNSKKGPSKPGRLPAIDNRFSWSPTLLSLVAEALPRKTKATVGRDLEVPRDSRLERGPRVLRPPVTRGRAPTARGSFATGLRPSARRQRHSLHGPIRFAFERTNLLVELDLARPE